MSSYYKCKFYFFYAHKQQQRHELWNKRGLCHWNLIMGILLLCFDHAFQHLNIYDRQVVGLPGCRHASLSSYSPFDVYGYLHSPLIPKYGPTCHPSPLWGWRWWTSWFTCKIGAKIFVLRWPLLLFFHFSGLFYLCSPIFSGIKFKTSCFKILFFVNGKKSI